MHLHRDVKLLTAVEKVCLIIERTLTVEESLALEISDKEIFLIKNSCSQ